MQIFRLFFSFFLLFALLSCEKELSSGEQTINFSDELPDDVKNSALTVADAVNVEPGYWITVKGYIVAAAESSIKNADFRSPFAGKTAILLADEPSEGTDEQFYDNLLPISLSDAAKGISASFNLQENANRWNNFVYIHGIRKQYMSVPGIKEVTNIWIGDPDEQPDPVVDPSNPNNPNNPDNPNNPNNPNNPDNPDNPDDPDNVYGTESNPLTVSQAILALSEHTIWVKGYIVGTTRKAINNTKFDGILDDFTAIVLAEEPGTTDKKQLFPVGVNKASRPALAEYGDNLINMQVIVNGNKPLDGYMKQPGINNAYKIVILQ